MKLSEMRQLLGERGIQLTRSLGQNFLHDQNQIERIVRMAELQTGDHVLEIGPGLGPLTERLLTSGAHVLAIEKDRRLCYVLRERFAGHSGLDLRNADALEVLKKEAMDWTDWKLVSNLPYSVGSPILVELAMAKGAPERLVATLQLEVVQRIAARAGEEHFGLLSLLLQARYAVQSWFKIPAGCFFPAPDVDSACVLLTRRSPELLPPSRMAAFTALVKLSFSERRKIMAKLLKQRWPAAEVVSAMEKVGIPAQARAETVALEQFIALAALLQNEGR